MKIKIKLTSSKIFKYIYLAIPVLNVIAIVFLTVFILNNVYKPITIEDDDLNVQIDHNSGKINIDKFNTIEEKSKFKKNITNNNKNIKNIFK
ncbi:hypothetical protein KAI92_01410 [Candidatus Parcubacteria bacterium]|nr:hypothetical protein [Candidatus Parcubacteria bacterium]